MSKQKAKIGFGDDLDEIQSNPEATLEDVYGQRVEYSRNLLYKYILTPHTQDVKRTRKDHGGLASVPLFPEEEEAIKQAAAYKGMSLNDFIRDAALDRARSVLMTAHKKAVEADPKLKDEPNKFTKIMSNPLNKQKVTLTEEEHLELSQKRKNAKNK
ncbi:MULTISPECIES: DUF1778 domain-containing protein [unclassified Acinetobacter]|uniref:type II toxin-antitoxin system TacA family antitoxin n=1 Tax=unclassified Acinetobacter TaxID=196816 RepID=UPI0015D0F2EF|nr:MULTISPECIES: DUF1778 domain-containing protein [unclassified Acinetobacter]